MSVYRTERYVNFYTGYGFKRLLGSKPAKHLLMDFLNSLMEQPLKGDQKIVSLTYLKNEHVSQSEEDRRAVYDINYAAGQAHKRGLAESLEKGHSRRFGKGHPPGRKERIHGHSQKLAGPVAASGGHQRRHGLELPGPSGSEGKNLDPVFGRRQLPRAGFRAFLNADFAVEFCHRRGRELWRF